MCIRNGAYIVPIWKYIHSITHMEDKMAKIFISYSSENKDFARKLALDFTKLGHEPWLDEWEIKVGESILSKIEYGISEADYVVVVLSTNSVKSGWVEREWKTKYWEEIEQNKTSVLPVLIEDCKIPPLLKCKKYADFRKDYAVGLAELTSTISPTIKKTGIEKVKPTGYSSDISDLLSKIQSRTIPLSQCIAEALGIAQKVKNDSLERFCRNELTGWDQKKLDEYPNEKPAYRLIEVFISPFAKINLQCFELRENASNVFDYMRKDSKHFSLLKTLVPESVSQIESKRPANPQKEIMTTTTRQKYIVPESKTPDAPVFEYARANSYMNVLESIRVELTRRLLDLLPRIENK